MRVGLITTSYPRWPGDPAGGFVEGHATAIRALGHHVDVIAAGDRSEQLLTREPDRIASPLFYTGGAPDLLERDHRALLAAASFSARLAIAVARRSRRWDAIVAHWLAPSALVAALAAPRHLPLVAIAHGGDVFTLRRLGLLAPALHLLRARGARLVFVSSALRQIAADTAPWLLDDAIVQPMGIDLARFAAIPRAPTPRSLLVVARLVPIKGVDVAIDALAHTDANLVIAGDGPSRAALEARAAALHLPIRFVGAVSTHERDALLHRAAAVLVPSRALANTRTEGTPTIALEALAAGVPVIGSRVGGLAELPIHHVPSDDAPALAAAIAHTLAVPPRAATLRASVAHLDWPQVAGALAPHLRDA